MRFRVYSGPRGAAAISPLEKSSIPFKECDSLDGALSWARHLDTTGRVALSIDGDDGTVLNKQEIASALKHADYAQFEPRSSHV